MSLLDRLRLLWTALTMKPIAGGADDPEPEPKDDPKDDPAPDPKPDPEPDPEPEGDKTDWRSQARRHESKSKRLEARANKLELKLKELEDADKSEQEKAIQKARDEAAAEAKSAAEKDRRSDRLEVAVTRLAAKGVQVGEGDEAKPIRFEDPEDALVFVERQITKGDLDTDEIFDDEGKVRPDALGEVLRGLLKAKPRLAAAQNGSDPVGDADAGKGKGDASKMSVDDHLADIQGRK